MFLSGTRGTTKNSIDEYKKMMYIVQYKEVLMIKRESRKVSDSQGLIIIDHKL